MYNLHTSINKIVRNTSDLCNDDSVNSCMTQALVELNQNMERNTSALYVVLEEVRDVNRGFRKMEHLILSRGARADRDVVVDHNRLISINKKMIHSQDCYDQYVTIKISFQIGS